MVEEFNKYRERMNARILEQDNLTLKRFWSLDGAAYQDGALDVRTKEMLGLVASMVLRCDDCIRYHLGKCHEAGLSTSELMEVFAIANLVGGSIVIPHTRRAMEYWDELHKK
ncbi:MAG: carboxymuconolactone decarboxylase family protein [Sphingobacteriales bacterium]|jgi:AhpD family alkylhydroperoxidase|nr:carboxymuconolactone decarboxylase family protein [Sphingobacteriales bacterium]